MIQRRLRTRRVLLFCPATDRKKVEKAGLLGADSVVVDLEDSVALSKKEEARELARVAFSEVDFGKTERLLRVNPFGTGLTDEDVSVVGRASRPPDGFVLPKVESAADVRRMSTLLSALESYGRLAPGSLKLLLIIETARGVARLGEIAAASPRVETLIFGAEDLCGDMGATRTREGREVFYARSAVVLHAAAERLQAIDTVFIDLGDQAGLVDETREALAMGYTGKLAIHPRQVEPIVRVFTPSQDEITGAARLIREHGRHQADGKGVFSLDGKMVDMPMVRAAERVLARARAAGILETHG